MMDLRGSAEKVPGKFPDRGWNSVPLPGSISIFCSCIKELSGISTWRSSIINHTQAKDCPAFRASSEKKSYPFFLVERYRAISNAYNTFPCIFPAPADNIHIDAGTSHRIQHLQSPFLEGDSTITREAKRAPVTISGLPLLHQVSPISISAASRGPT